MPQFEKGNKAHELYTEEQAKALFKEMYDNCLEDNNMLCVQDVFLNIGMRSSTFYYLIEKFPDLELIKNDIKDVIVSRINAGALNGKFKETASIWRMKQCGEVDEKTNNLTNNGKDFEPPTLNFFDDGE